MGKDLLKILKAISDETRMRILCLLSASGLCVCEIEEILRMNQSNVSRHLIKLKEADLIISEKQGQFVFHSLNEEQFGKYSFLKALLSQASEISKFQKDIKSLNTLIDENKLTCRIENN